MKTSTLVNLLAIADLILLLSVAGALFLTVEAHGTTNANSVAESAEQQDRL